jgi:lambda repressor-like predicted transcriptional regulator
MEFVDWVNRKIETQGWSMRDLARHSGLSHSTVANVLSRKTKVTGDFCIGIARAFHMDVSEVVDMAGLLPGAHHRTTDPGLLEVLRLLDGMSSDQLSEVRRYARYIATREGSEPAAKPVGSS